VGWLRNQLPHTVNWNRSSLAAHGLNAREWLVHSLMTAGGKRFALVYSNSSGKMGPALMH
jgi:hypothetical protein